MKTKGNVKGTLNCFREPFKALRKCLMASMGKIKGQTNCYKKFLNDVETTEDLSVKDLLASGKEFFT